MINKISQKQAVIDATRKIMGSAYNSTVAVTETLTKNDINGIKSMVYDGIVSGDVIFNKEFSETEVKKYVSGMVSNHFRKAKELNGGASYKPKVVGTRIVKDPKLNDLNTLLSNTKPGTEEHVKVMEAVTARKSEIAVKKNNTYDIDVTVLPDDLKAVIKDEM